MLYFGAEEYLEAQGKKMAHNGIIIHAELLKELVPFPGDNFQRFRDAYLRGNRNGMADMVMKELIPVLEKLED